MAPRPLAVITGWGPVTGAIAKRFAKSYNVALLGASPSIRSTTDEINFAGGQACLCPIKLFSENNIQNAFKLIDSMFPGSPLAAVIFNRNNGHTLKPFMKMSTSDFMNGVRTQVKAGFHFSQLALPLLCAAKDQGLEHPPTLIFTGHSSSLKGSPISPGYAAGKGALRNLAQSLAYEFGPRGIHVAHTVLEGQFTRPAENATDTSGAGDHCATTMADAIAHTYWMLHTQPTSAMTFELDLRQDKKWAF